MTGSVRIGSTQFPGAPGRHTVHVVRFSSSSAALRVLSASFYNSRMPAPLLRKLCALDEAGERTLEMAVRRMNFSARAHDRILKVARSVADLAESPAVAAKHIAEAVPDRSPDRSYWT